MIFDQKKFRIYFLGYQSNAVDLFTPIYFFFRNCKYLINARLAAVTRTRQERGSRGAAYGAISTMMECKMITDMLL